MRGYAIHGHCRVLFWRTGIPILLALVLLDGHELVTEALPLEFCISLS